MQGEIKEAKNIVILGGGPTGIEFAGVSPLCADMTQTFSDTFMANRKS
jgi:NADH dehydrogenase FAD-containing subunit